MERALVEPQRNTQHTRNTEIHTTRGGWEKGGAQNFALFASPSPFSLLSLSGGLCVELWLQVEAKHHPNCAFWVSLFFLPPEAAGVSPPSPPPPSPIAHVGWSEREKKERNLRRKRGNKERKFGRSMRGAVVLIRTAAAMRMLHSFTRDSSSSPPRIPYLACFTNFLCGLAFCRPCSAEDLPMPFPPIPTVDLFLSHCYHSTNHSNLPSNRFNPVPCGALLAASSHKSDSQELTQTVP